MRSLAYWAGAFVLAFALPSMARAGERLRGTPALPAYQAECGACHFAYPPGLLPAASWQRLMAGLPRHFGTDASLDTETLRQLTSWLESNAAVAPHGDGQAGTPPEDRITRSRWFLREHHEVPAPAWRRPSVGAAGHCEACHVNAAQGDFNEHDARIPR